MGQVGARVASPLTLLREYIIALRSLLDGQEVTTSGRYVKLDGVRLEWPPLAPPELLAGATGPGAQDRLMREYQRWGLEPGKQAGVAGNADEIARAVGECARAGAGTVVLQPTTDEPDMAGFARFVAQQVRPLVKGPNDLDGLFARA